MDSIVVRGGTRLRGEVQNEGAKNAALPVLFAALLTEDACVFHNVPAVVDVRTALRLLADLGAEVQQEGSTVWVRAKHLRSVEAPYELVKTMRASFLTLGPLLARCGEARVSTPGGCAIGARPVDLHLKGLEQLGAAVSEDSNSSGLPCKSSTATPRLGRGACVGRRFIWTCPR